MICSTLASLLKFQYFQRSIYNPVEHDIMIFGGMNGKLKIEKLILEGVKFDHEKFEFPSLIKLKIIGNLRGDGLEGKRVVCARLRVLRLEYIYHVENFERLFCDSLEALFVTSVYDLNDSERATIFYGCESLRKFNYETKYEEIVPICRPRFPKTSKWTDFSKTVTFDFDSRICCNLL